MEYFVIGPDGKEYGPATIDTLKQWVVEQRLFPTTMLKSFQTGLTVQASTVAGLFPSAPPAGTPPQGNWAQPPSPYPRQQQQYANVDDGKMDVVWAILRSALALVLFFALGGIGLIVGAYGLVYAIRAQQKGHKLGVVAIAISAVALVAIAIGWMFRLKH